MNVRDRKLMDIWKIALDSGAASLDTINPGDVKRWGFDSQLQVRAAVGVTKEGATEIRVRDQAKAAWKVLMTAGLEETLEFVDFTEDGSAIIIESSINSDTSRLIEKSLKSGAERVLASHDKSDLVQTLGYPTRRGVRAAAFVVDGRTAWQPTEPSMKVELEALKAATAGDFTVVSMDGPDTKWVVAQSADVSTERFFMWDRKAKKGQPLFTAQPKLDAYVFAPTKPVTITSRDGLSLPAYVTMPVGKTKSVPMVVHVHGGPWGRDSWGGDTNVQWLANRGYAVLQVNFRGSKGFGKRFLNAGNRQWGLAMQDDLSDAVAWAVEEGIADPKRVAIMGASYGGYATLAGLSLTPSAFACGVDMVGPSNLFTLMKGLPPYWSALKRQMVLRVGDPENPADQELLTRASPLFSAHKIVAPLLIGQGANDPRVPVIESEQVVKALELSGVPVTYVLYRDEGHGFSRAENKMDFYARAEAFLAQCLGGRFEPLPSGGIMAGSTAQVKVVTKKN
jgi:dipeptidyl aminopeptidase/acylaminoacyl peptidase